MRRGSAERVTFYICVGDLLVEWGLLWLQYEDIVVILSHVANQLYQQSV